VTSVRARQVATEKLKEIIQRQMFECASRPQQQVIAAEQNQPMRKNVLAKCYAATLPKAQLLEKQKEGKKRMKSIGSVEIPQEAFMSVLTIGE